MGMLPQRALQFSEPMLHHSLLLDVIIYNAWLSACKKGMLPQKALQLGDLMLRQGLLPDVIIYNA